MIWPTSARAWLGKAALAFACATFVSIPAGYLAFRFGNAVQEQQFKADLVSAQVASYIDVHQAHWQDQFELRKLLEKIGNVDRGSDVLRLRGADGRVLAQVGPALSGPLLTRSHPVAAAGGIVGRVESVSSLRSMLWDTAFAALLGAALGFGAFLAVRVLPFRALDRTRGQLEAAHLEIEAAYAQLKTQYSRFDAALNNLSQGLCMFDAEGRLVVLNRKFSAMFGSAAPDIRIGMSTSELIAAARAIVVPQYREPKEFLARLQQFVLGDEAMKEVLKLTTGRSLFVNREPLPTGGWVATFEDITERQEAEAKINHLKCHDALTGLPNRGKFHEQLGRSLAQASRQGQLAILVLDLDDFKSVNDTLGHPVGDQLLRAVAGRIADAVGRGVLMARLGGDEFAVLQQAEDQAAVPALAARLIDAVSAPFELYGHQISVGLSIGIVMPPADGVDPDQLLKNADLALYRAKADGRGTYRFFEAEMDARMQARRSLELDLRKAIAERQFEVHYQPIINLASDRISGFEALIRWRHPTRGMVPPIEFIPLAEETGLVIPIGEWVVREACGEAATWPETVKVAVNLSVLQVQSRNLVSMVIQALAAARLPADRLELEVTESILLNDNEATLATLRQLRDLGVRISMDDFGTGYSSLGYVRQFPFDKIKIDRSFIRDMADHDDSLAIVRAVTGLGLSLGMTTTAEGVETRAQLDRLKEEGCTEVQGYFFSPPRPREDLPRLLAEYGPRMQAVA